MKVMIDIPKEFETDLQDKFNEFFERVKYDINSLWELQEVSMCGNYEREIVEMFLSAFEKATVIPDDATNGDMIKVMFPNIQPKVVGYTEYIGDEEVNGREVVLGDRICIEEDYWNTSYKKEVEE